ncbi:MAG: globin-coupled sensor protein, partial [Rhodospirillales bacterium]|nr:globin-coupled sensor protein [Rhodospirillales bacterium]
MSAIDDVDHRRLLFLGLTDDARPRLAAFWRHAAPQLPRILDAFYQHVSSVPALATLVGPHLARLKPAQSQHWERLFSGRFDDDYFASVRRVGRAHVRIGLEPRWYIGGYNFVLPQFTAIIRRVHRFSPAAQRRMESAVMAAAFLDMDVALSVYMDGSMAEAAQARSMRVANLTTQFASEAGEMMQVIAAAATELHATAASMAVQAAGTAGDGSAAAVAAQSTNGSVQIVASATEELTASTLAIGEQIKRAGEITQRAVAQANRTDVIVQALAGAAQKIGEVV